MSRPAARTIPILCILLATLSAGSIAEAAPVLRLPGAGPVVATDESPVRDGFDQRIQFGGGGGTNAARIGIRTQTADLVLAFPANLSRPNRAGIDAEIAALFPGQTLRVLSPPRRNAYGPVGMAIGTDCLYAWQWIDLTRPMMGGGGDRPRLFGPLSRADPVGAASLRIRLCRTERASLPDLIAAVETMTLDLSARSRADTAVAPVVTSPPRQRRVTRRPAVVEASRQKRHATTPTTRAPAVASTEASSRRFLVPPAAPVVVPSSSEPGPRPVAAAPGSAGPLPAPPRGARYITDAIQSSEAPDRTVSTRPPDPAGRPERNDGLSRDLPVQAYDPLPAGRR